MALMSDYERQWTSTPCSSCRIRTMSPGVWYCHPCLMVKEEVYKHFREHHWGAIRGEILDAVARAADETTGRTWPCCAIDSEIARASWLEVS